MLWYNKSMDWVQELKNNNDARLILANAQAKFHGWSDKGSIQYRAIEILEHANDYLYAQVMESDKH